MAGTESKTSYDALFRALKDRGLRGVELVTSDDHRGLVAAIGRQFQGASWRRCQVYVARNLGAAVPQSKRRELTDELRGIFAASTRTQAMAIAARWRPTHPKVARFLEEELESSLTCLALPAEHRVRIRTMNGVERLNQKLKRRTRAVRIFPNRASLLRLVTALVVEQSEEWMSGRRYLDMTLRAISAEGRAVTPLAAAAD